MSERNLSEELRDYAEAVRQGFEDVPAEAWAERAAALEAEVAEWRTIALNHSTDAVVTRQQRDALAAENERLRADAEGNWSDYASATVRHLETENTALRARIAEAVKVANDWEDADELALAFVLAQKILAILAPEGEE